MRIAHLSLTDYRNYERAEVSFDAGPTLDRRAQRPGQDEPGRGDRVPGDSVVAPGVERSAADPGGAGCRDHPGTTAELGSGTAGRAADQSGRGQPSPAQSRGGQAAGVGAVLPQRAVRTRGHRARARRAVGAPPLPRRTARAADPAPGRRDVRLRAGGASAQHPAEVGAGQRTARRQAQHPRHLGRAARRARVRDHRRATEPHRPVTGSAACGVPVRGRRRPGSTPGSGALDRRIGSGGGGRRRRMQFPQPPARRRARHPSPRSPRGSATCWRDCAVANSTGPSRSSGRTATTSS